MDREAWWATVHGVAKSQRYDQVTNTQRYNYGSTYMNSMGTTNQKPTTDRQKTKRNSSILQKTIIKPQWEKQKEEMNKEEHKQLENKV